MAAQAQTPTVCSNYTVTTKWCLECHSVHAASPNGEALLPGKTITDDCNTCHDGTGGQGVYGVIKARLAVAPTSAHRTETATVVPGGDSATGGNKTMAFSGAGGTLTCTDCHSPHGADTVAPFRGDRQRSVWGVQPHISTKLLKKRPGNVAVPVAQYGSDWCLGCHKGRSSAGFVHNHPAESSATVAFPYAYGNAPLVAPGVTTSSTALGQLGITNRGYLMPFPRTTGAGGQAGHFPMCQQCHEDAREVGTLNANGTASPYAFIVNNPPDGRTITDNPRFQVFPHESTATAMLIQQNDDLCMNCHPTGQLP